MAPIRKALTAALILIALGLLYPGVTQPVLTLTGTIEKSAIAQLGIDVLVGDEADGQARQMLNTISSLMGWDRIEGELLLYETTRSIWSTTRKLAETGNLLVAVLIVLFSVVIPTLKLLLQLASMFIPSVRWRESLLWLNGVLSKWSMADVFVMALLVAYMVGSASEQMGDLNMQAQLQAGFWFFLGYCLFAVASSALLRREQPLAATSG
jgi:hypothetical protein